MESGLQKIIEKYPTIGRNASRAPQHLGTLGTGNHFIEICLDLDGAVWVMLHSGSRGIGNRIGSFFTELAKKEMERWFINLPDKDLAYLSEGSQYFGDYVQALSWAQKYASINRELMLEAALQCIREICPPFTLLDSAINCHHNYVEKERHFGKDVWLTRKGAVKMNSERSGIIPGSMGAKSFIVRGVAGKALSESYCSCSHGAGRLMSRNEAKRRFTIEDHALATIGVECRKDAEVIDETPQAYKTLIML